MTQYHNLARCGSTQTGLFNRHMHPSIKVEQLLSCHQTFVDSLVPTK